MASAPVCNNALPNVIGQPDPNLKNVPAIPEANDLQSALAAINVMRRMLQQLMNPGGIDGFKTQKSKNKGFRELRKFRVTKKTRVFNPNDHSQFVDVEQIVGMVMQDPSTGQTWQWQQ